MCTMCSLRAWHKLIHSHKTEVYTEKVQVDPAQFHHRFFQSESSRGPDVTIQTSWLIGNGEENNGLIKRRRERESVCVRDRANEEEKPTEEGVDENGEK